MSVLLQATVKISSCILRDLVGLFKIKVVCLDKICLNAVKRRDLGKSLSTSLCCCRILSMFKVSTTCLLTKHTRKKFIFKHHVSGGLLKQIN